ncbi:MAG: PAS domain-containing protein, partial [Clostridiales bacterium]|nr:PAS domain-containing protein [Clostridiales bacterium]
MTKKIYKLTRSRETLTEEKNSLAIEYNTRLATNTRLLNERAEQGEYLQLVLKNSEDIIMFLDKDARILYYAESFKRAVRVDKSAVLTGQKIYDVWEKFISVEDAAAAEARFQKTKDLRETIYENITISFIGENEARHFRTIYTPLIDVTGAFDGVLAIYYDSTQLIKALKHAEEANNAKNNFLISMSHEIRTPMNAIIGMGELIRTDNLDDVQKNYLKDIKKM